MDIRLKDAEIIDLIDDDFEDSLQNAEDLSLLREEDFATYRGAPYEGDDERRKLGYNTTVNTVVANALNWTLPGLVEIFSDDFFQFRIEDQDFAEALRKYIRKLWFRMQDGEKKNDAFLHDCLLFQVGGFFKICYDQITSKDTIELEQVADDVVQRMIENGAEMTEGEKVEEILEGETVTYWQNVKMVRDLVEYEGPVISVPAPDEIGWSSEAKNLEDARLVWHRTIRNFEYIQRMEEEGDFRKGTLKRARTAALDETAEETRQERDSRYYLDGLSAPNEGAGNLTRYPEEKKEVSPATEFYLYEIYTSLDIDGDGVLEDVIIWRSGNLILGIKENQYKRVPIRRGVPFPVPHQFLQESYGRTLGDMQKNLTTIDRLTYDAAAKATYQNLGTSDKKVFNQLKKRKPNSVFLLPKGDMQAAIQDFTPRDPGQYTLKAKELMQGEIENRSGVTRYNQGLDANSLNKTLGGIERIMTASQQRQRLVARRLGWTFRDVIADFIRILDQWPTDEYTALLSEYGMRPGQIRVEDIVIDVGVSFQEKFAMAQQMESIIQFGISAGLQLGQTPEQIWAAQKKKYDLLGIRTEGIIPDENQLRQFQQQQQAAAGGVPPEAQMGPAGEGGAPEPGLEGGAQSAPPELGA